jgi:ATP-dependent Clp protease ATP-binding subunit ClpC
MFERYTDECKRAVFFARETALHKNTAAIDSDCLLLGLLTEYWRGRDIFRLRERLPDDAARQDLIAQQSVVEKKDIPLSDDGKRILAYTAQEANRLRDYWIDTDHLVLGILREETSAAAAKLREVGLNIDASRQRVIDNKNSRPERRTPVLWWPGTSRDPFTVFLQIAFLIGVIFAMFFLARTMIN